MKPPWNKGQARHPGCPHDIACQLAKKSGVNEGTIKKRIALGWPKELWTVPPRAARNPVPHRCSECDQPGHNVRTCPKARQIEELMR